MSNKAQATIFIILGILIIIGGITAYAARDYLGEKLGIEILKTKAVPPQAEKLNNFITDCIQETLQKGSSLIGQQGGKLEVLGPPQSQLNLFSNYLTIQTIKVPYWFYMQNGIQKIEIPTKSEIEENLENYLDNNLRKCIGTFGDFQEFKIEDGATKSEISLTQENIYVTVNLPLKITKQDFIFEFPKFKTKIDSRLLLLYQQAKQIIQTEIKTNFLEEKTTDFISNYEELPFTGTTEDCVAPLWFEENIEPSLKKILFNNIQLLKIKNTAYTLAEDSHKYYETDTKIKDKNLDVNFYYSENWPIELEIEPKAGELLKGQSITDALGELKPLAENFVCISVYHFLYDLRYPILIKLSKDDDYFQFATQIVIDKNQPRIAENLPEIPEKEVDFCMLRSTKGTIATTSEGKPLENTDISYKCSIKNCKIGTTKLDQYNSASLTDNFPVCIGGSIVATKDNYAPAKIQIDTNTKFTASVELESYKELNVATQIMRAGSGEPRKTEEIYISLQGIDNEHSTALVYPSQDKIKLIPGIYKVETYLISDFKEGLTIKSRKFEKCFDVPKKSLLGVFGQTEKKCTLIEIPGMTLYKTVTGAVNYETTITKSQLTQNKIIFYVPYKGIPKTSEDLALENVQVPQPKFE